MTVLLRASLLAGVFVIAQGGGAQAQFWQSLQYRYYPPADVRQDSYTRQDRSRLDRQDPRDRPRKSSRTSEKSKRDVPVRHPFGENMPKGPLQLVISLGDQRATLYSNGVRVGDARVSTGVPGHPTPTGVFSIIQKNRWHRSNLYSNAPMFYMHRLTWSGIALHEGHLPGYPASHGCIRMPTDFVSRLWGISKLGMRVVVARVEVKPQEISHAKLFNPAPKPVDTNRTSEAPATLRSSIDTTGQGHVRVAEAPAGATAPATATDVPAAASTPSAASNVPATVEPARSAPSDAAAVTHEAPAASAASEPVSTATSTTPPAEPAPAAPAATPTAPAAATPATAGTEPARPAIDPNELDMQRPAPPLRSRTAEPPKLNGQVAVFISGKEKRIFVRHAFVPLFDMPIEIAHPEKPLGTHTYTALQASDDGTRMRWNVISMPLTLQPAAPASGKKGSPKQQQRVAKRGAVITHDSSNAADALDRVTIPQEAIDRISELLTPGSSLIISDEGLGRETGRYTEFIVETR